MVTMRYTNLDAVGYLSLKIEFTSGISQLVKELYSRPENITHGLMDAIIVLKIVILAKNQPCNIK